MSEKEILQIAEKYVNKNGVNNGVCISIRVSEIKNEDSIKKLVECGYIFNSAMIHEDGYGIRRLIFFNE